MAFQPLVSILINNYNYGHFLSAAIDSALNQTYSNLEVIVVDDGSTDKSQQVIEAYGDRIVAILKTNGGQASAFNIGFEQSQGDIICFLDSDDIFLANKIEKVVKAFEEYQEAGWCYHPLRMVNLSLEAIEPSQSYSKTSNLYDIRQRLCKGKLRGELPIQGTATSGICFQRKLLEQILPMPEEIQITSDDYIKYAALGIDKGIVLLEEIALQRIHGNNAYTNQSYKDQLRAEIAILTAYWLRRNFPILATFTDKIFAFGLATYLQIGDRQIYFQKIIDEYQSSLTPIRWLKINLRSYFYLLKYHLRRK